jgi:hypothetical protein
MEQKIKTHKRSSVLRHPVCLFLKNVLLKLLPCHKSLIACRKFIFEKVRHVSKWEGESNGEGS